MDDRVRCKFCDWSTVRYFTKKTGGVSNPQKAYERLHHHMLMEHEDEWTELMHKLDGEFDEHKCLTLYDEDATMPYTLEETLERK